ncbi:MULTISPECIES: hypothetical protein [unclassified Micromonospora]|uniref:hypothetical protein n=1 Tax=unclassified Micromonospora TaxID=2617518 RepID=UPI001C5E9DAA|nr:hypothetical protein [Micromonospora sp. RL09-050-HVF-A]MBW4700986.1 hypothetical protein [Micromonospora sp. RL09-050-HVF-A]
MTDPYRIADAPTKPEADLLRPLLWLVLVVSLAANAALTTVFDNQWAGSACGLLAVLCAGTLLARHRRAR